jgi:hypothetical protein
MTKYVLTGGIGLLLGASRMKGESKREENGTEAMAAFHGKMELLLAARARTLARSS